MFITADSLHLLNGYRPTEQQRAFHNAAENYLVVLAGAGMGSGKTSAMINQILIHLLRYPNSRGLLTREERESFSRTTLQTLLRWLPASQVKKHRSKAGEITFLNGSMLFYGAGLTGTRGLARAKGLEISVLGIDQAEEVSEQAFDLLAGTRVRTADPKVHLSVLLTANPSPCWLRTRYVRHVSANAKYIPMLTEQNPHVDPNYLKRMEEILPTERYNQYARGDWDAVDAINAIFRLEDIEAAMSRKVERGTPVKLSCDVSRAGKSATVIAIQYGNKIELASVVKGRDDAVDVFHRIIHHAHEEKDSIVIIDGPNVGGAIVDMLHEKEWTRVKEFNGSVSPENRERFVNLRSEVIWKLFEALPRIALPNDRHLKEEMLAMTYEVRRGKIFVMGKEDLAKKGISCDRFDAIALLFFHTPDMSWPLPKKLSGPDTRPPAVIVDEYMMSRGGNHIVGRRYT